MVCSHTAELVIGVTIFNTIFCITRSLKQNTVTGMSEEEKERLLHCVVIGGGPTGVEFSGELSDFIIRDVRQRYTHVKNYVRVTLIEVRLRLCFITWFEKYTYVLIV